MHNMAGTAACLRIDAEVRRTNEGTKNRTATVRRSANKQPPQYRKVFRKRSLLSDLLLLFACAKRRPRSGGERIYH